MPHYHRLGQQGNQLRFELPAGTDPSSIVAMLADESWVEGWDLDMAERSISVRTLSKGPDAGLSPRWWRLFDQSTRTTQPGR